MRKIILASKSPRRKELLTGLGIKFKIHASTYEEDKTYATPEKTALMHAKHKAKDVAQHYKDAIIIGVDTLGAYKGKIIGKPKDKKDAKRILKFLNNSRHEVISGIYVIDTKSKKEAGGTAATYVKFCKMTDKNMDAYINSGEGNDKAAGYAIQGIGSLFVEKIEGEYFNVVGLPIFKLVKTLKRLGLDLPSLIR
ncbi:MAG: Maf family protein [Patescibacteria group bacterium]|nr:septum formation protein Maf [Patescibacteria group bacterium]